MATKITRFDRVTATSFAAIVVKAVRPIAEHFGVTVTNAGGSITDKTFTLKLRFGAQAANGEAMSAEAHAFRQNATAYGLSPDDLGRTFRTERRSEYEIVGMKPRNRKYPVLAKHGEKTYKFSALAVKRYLAGVQ